MSHDATTWAKTQQTGTGTAKLILLLLADYAGTDYSCYPSIAKLAEVSELAESTVRSVTKLLAEKGLIRVFYRHRASGLRRSCRYQLLIDGPDTAGPDAEDWSSYRQIPAEDNRQQVAEEPPAGSGYARQQVADIPIKEPSLKNEPPTSNHGASRAERATRLSEDFTPDEKMREWFAAERLAQTIDGRIEHQKFMNYWLAKPGKDGRKIDWRRTWMNWMLEAATRAERFNGHRPGNALAPLSGAPAQYKPSTGDQRVAQAQMLYEKYSQMEEGKKP